MNITVDRVVAPSVQIRVPLIGGIGFANLDPGEEWMTSILSVLLPRRCPGAFVDVGVNVGQTMLKVKAL